MPPNNTFHSIAARIQALTLLGIGMPIKEVSARLNIPVNTLYVIRKRAKERGFDPQRSLLVDISYVEDAPRSGSPKAIDPEKGAEVNHTVTKDQSGGEKSTEALALQTGIFHPSIVQILHKHCFVLAKST
ncbi:conserved hypothetical protein [Coccidioides posadasii str. Silveira]|uniref:Uncharacterized protein n=1 Tax=Coccidioides posadasii (strain RMSCC 757 / Silveira) TaxID=443226 RepID=E9D1V1_COCPS|nr:conserved hypothetical protein [Coccidioides posadasii str. Silveira]